MLGIKDLIESAFPKLKIKTLSKEQEMSQEHHRRSPFWEIPLEENEQIKVWDIEVPAFSKMDGKGRTTSQMGRVRILAVCPKKPELLTNIRYSISWCSPEDFHKYEKRRANEIVVGRWIKRFWRDKVEVRHTGVIPFLETLKEFPSVVMKQLSEEDQSNQYTCRSVYEHNLPLWFDYNSFCADNLERLTTSKKENENDKASIG